MEEAPCECSRDELPCCMPAASAGSLGLTGAVFFVVLIVQLVSLSIHQLIEQHVPPEVRHQDPC